MFSIMKVIKKRRFYFKEQAIALKCFLKHSLTFETVNCSLKNTAIETCATLCFNTDIFSLGVEMILKLERCAVLNLLLFAFAF